jgi:kumamolisin
MSELRNRKVFLDSVTPLHTQQGLAPNGLMVHPMKPEHRSEKMTLLFSFEIPRAKQKELEERVAKGEVVPVEELQTSYGPDPGDLETLKRWLTDQGFEIAPNSPDRLGVYATATVDKIERSLAVNMARVTRDGITYSAAQNAPSLPADVGRNVHAIIGLQPFRHAHKHSNFVAPRSGSNIQPGDEGEGDLRAVRQTGNSPPYIVPEVLKAYKADGLQVTGKGQTIAILIDTLPRDADLKKFWQENGVDANLRNIEKIEKINVKGGHLPAPEGEETLDASWASGIAPGAKVRIYASGSLSFVDLDMALDRILEDLPNHPELRQLSISLGLGETYLGGPHGEIETQHQKLLRLVAAGVNVFVSSGDAGSNPDNTGHSSTGSTQVEFEASDPFVIGVGGTSLQLDKEGNTAAETGWSDSGGGASIFFDRPAWQTGQGVPAGTKRLVPDVSLTADPNNGAFLVLNGRARQIGGTSWSAPVWAGFCALINEARANAGKPPLPFLNPLIYPLLGTACFRDITAGSNGAFDAGAGYDLVTGIGVPNVAELIRRLTQ